MSLFGLLASTEKMVPEGRLHMRPFQFHLKEHWRYPQSLDSLRGVRMSDFLGELICLCTSTGIIILHLRFSFILSTKFVSPRILTVFLGAFYESFTSSCDDNVTSKMEVNRSVGRKYSFFSVITVFPGLFLHSFFIFLCALLFQSILCNNFHFLRKFYSVILRY